MKTTKKEVKVCIQQPFLTLAQKQFRQFWQGLFNSFTGIDALELHDMLEFAENYFNDHEKSPQGTISLGTLKRNAGR